MKCTFKDCNNEAKAGTLCWEHQLCGLQVDSDALERFKQRVNEIPVLGTVQTENAHPDVSVSDSDIENAISRRRLEDDLIAINAGKITFNIITKDVKSIGIWSVITAVAKLVSWWLSKK